MHAIANGDHTILDVFDIFADVKMTIWALQKQKPSQLPTHEFETKLGGLKMSNSLPFSYKIYVRRVG